MRRLTVAAALVSTVVLAACHRDQIIRPEPTEEGSAALLSTVNMGDPNAAVQLVKGFHNIEEHSWRWTMGRFSIIFHPPEGASTKRTQLVLHGNIPDSILKRLGPVTLTALIQTDPLGSVTVANPGPVTLTALVPAENLKGETVTFDFVLDKFIPAGTIDPRELGMILTSVSLESR